MGKKKQKRKTQTRVGATSPNNAGTGATVAGLGSTNNGNGAGSGSGGGGGGGGGRGPMVSMTDLARREIRRATAAVAAEDFGEAIRHFSQGILLGYDKKDIVVQILVSRAALWVLLRSYEDAATDSAVAVSLDKSHVRGWLRYAVALWHLKKYPESADCIRKAGDQLQQSGGLDSSQDIGEAELAAEDEAKREKRVDTRLQTLKRMQKMVMDKHADMGRVLLMESGLSDLEYDEARESEEVPGSGSGRQGKASHSANTNTNITSDSDWPEFFDKMPPLVPPENYYTHDYESMIDPDDETFEVTLAPGAALNPNVLTAATIEKNLGNTAFGAGDFSRALLHYTRAIRLNPNDHVFYSNRAATCLKLGRLHDAVSDCTTSVRLHPTIKAYARRAASWAAMEEWALSAQDYLSALRFEPQNKDVWAQLLNCFAQKEAALKAQIEYGSGSAAADNALKMLRVSLDRLKAGGPEGALTAGRKLFSL